MKTGHVRQNQASRRKTRKNVRLNLTGRIRQLEMKAVRKANKGADGDPEIALRMVKLYTDTIGLSLGNVDESVGAIRRVLRQLSVAKQAIKLYKTKDGKKKLEALERKMSQLAGKLEDLEVEFKALASGK